MRNRMKIGIVLAGIACLSGSAMAQSVSEPDTAPAATAPEALRNAAQQIMNGVRMMILAVPQYEAPVMLENGDILVRRKTPAPEVPAPDKDAPADL